jgi:hypothetical protein
MVGGISTGLPAASAMIRFEASADDSIKKYGNIPIIAIHLKKRYLSIGTLLLTKKATKPLLLYPEQLTFVA